MGTSQSIEVRELGIPVRAVFHCILHPGKDAKGRPSLLASMGQMAGGLLVLDINLEKGGCAQYECADRKAFEPTAVYRSPRDGILYMAACYTGTFHRYVPGSPAIELIGHVDPELATFPCRIDEAPDGSLFVGAYPGCCLSRYEPARNAAHSAAGGPATGQWTRYGRMDETDMYFYPLCGADGTVAGLVKMCKPHVVALDPKTLRHCAVGPVIETQERSGSIDLYKGKDGLLYIRSSEGNFRVQGLEAVKAAALPDPMPPRNTMPDGATVEFADQSTFDFRKVRLTPPKGPPRILSLDWRGAGTDIFLIHHGPDGRLYGSSILPERLFSCRPDGSDMLDHGQCSVSGGEAYSMGNLDGKLYIASYPSARLTIYDPKKPYKFGTEPGSNPRDVGVADPVACRPRAMLAGPAGKVWIGAVPDYGMWGGTLSAYDPKTETFTSHRHLIKDCNVVALAWLPKRERILVGTTVHGGSGTQPRADRCAFVWWDPRRDQADGIETFGIHDLHGIMDIVRVDDRHVYAVVVRHAPDPPPGASEHTAELALIDLDERRVIDRSRFGGEFGWPLEVALQKGPDGAWYGATKVSLYRITPGTAQRAILWRCGMEESDQQVSVGGPIVGHTYYFASAHRLRAIEIPEGV
ncbi:MAG: hypothetical protein HYV36_06885 [Lentisphaerae bacterium]|nr:hypothetical protein [Lentisphaerota bacterium]